MNEECTSRTPDPPRRSTPTFRAELSPTYNTEDRMMDFDAARALLRERSSSPSCDRLSLPAMSSDDTSLDVPGQAAACVCVCVCVCVCACVRACARVRVCVCVCEGERNCYVCRPMYSPLFSLDSSPPFLPSLLPTVESKHLSHLTKRRLTLPSNALKRRPTPNFLRKNGILDSKFSTTPVALSQ